MRPGPVLLPIFLPTLLFAFGCAGPSLPDPSGVRVYVRLLGPERLIFDGREQSWEAALTELEARVRRAGNDASGRPWVVILADRGGDGRTGSRFLDALREIGVTSISLGN